MRSLLFVPGDSAKKQEKAAQCGADVLILDLEDSVAAANKQAAREQTRTFLHHADRASGPKLFVRMNALDTEFWLHDLTTVMPAMPDGLMIPKTLSGDCVRRVALELDRLEREVGVEQGATKLVCVATETAASLFTLGTYAGSSARLAGLSWGAEDLAADLGVYDNRDETGRYTDAFRLARTLTLLGAVKAEALPIDTIYKEFRDAEGLRAEAEAAKRDGFRAKMAIHPHQVATINEVFTPSADEIERARRIVDAFTGAGDVGVVGLDGVMLDRPHLRQAERILAQAKEAGLLAS